MPRTIRTKSKRKIHVKTGRNTFDVYIVCVYHHGSVPATIHCYAGDVVIFVNCSKKKQVTITFDHSPFVPGNPPQVIEVDAKPVACGVVGPQGDYTSNAEASGMSSGQPDGPAVIVQ
jgi:hypothetical protein